MSFTTSSSECHAEGRLEGANEHLGIGGRTQRVAAESATTDKTLEEMDWVNWLGFTFMIIIVGCIATPFGAIAMFISARATTRGRELLRQIEIEEILEDERVREQVRRGY